MKISLVIPVFNGEKTLSELYARIKLTLEGLFDYEVLFIHDGGSAEAWVEITRLKSRFGSAIKAIRLSHNFGQHNAIKCGIEHSEGDFIVTIDEDLQHAPEDILKLIEYKNQNDFELVYGVYKKRNHSTIRNISSICLNRLLRFVIPKLHKDYSSFRLADSKTVKKTLNLITSYSFLDGDLAMVTNKVSSIPVSHFKSVSGKSSYTFSKLLWHSISILAAYSKQLIKTLKLLSFILIAVALTAFSGIIFKLDYTKGRVNEAIENLAIIALLSGLLLFGLWIIAAGIEKYNLKRHNNSNYEIMELL